MAKNSDALMAADERFAASVKALREERGWSQGEFATRLRDAGLDSFHPTTVARIEKGERLVRLGEARVVADVLGTLVGVMVAPGREGLAVQALQERVNDFTEARRALEAAAGALHLERMILHRELGEVEAGDYAEWADEDLRLRVETIVNRSRLELDRPDWKAVEVIRRGEYPEEG